MLIFSFRGVGALRKGKRGAEHRGSAPLLLYSWVAFPQHPPIPSSGREALLLPGAFLCPGPAPPHHAQKKRPRRSGGRVPGCCDLWPTS